MTKWNSDLADYLAENIAGLTRWTAANRDGNARIDSVDPELSGLQVCVFWGTAGNPLGITGVRTQNGTIEIIGEETAAFNMARLIYDSLQSTPSFQTDNINFKYVDSGADIIRRGLWKPGITNYGIEITVQYTEN